MIDSNNPYDLQIGDMAILDKERATSKRVRIMGMTRNKLFCHVEDNEGTKQSVMMDRLTPAPKLNML